MSINLKKLNISSPKIIFFIFALVFVPIIVDAFAFDLGAMQLGALSEKTGPLMTLFMGSYFFFVLGLMGLWISTTLLQAIIEVTPEALTVMGGDASAIVQAGWNFTVGIGNMLLLVAFVVIALATILGYENYHFKKLLPRLIVVAFLMNFTLLFVGLGIDVTNFLFNSVANQFSEDGGNILFNAIRPLFVLGNTVNVQIIALFSSIAASLLIPYLNVAIQVGWIIFFLPFILPIIIQLLAYGLIFFLLTGTFLFYFVIFVARIFIIQILAILGPVAFFTLIFPNTESWWKKWLQYLIQWLFVGVVFIFLMYVGLALAPLAGSLVDPAVDTDAPNFISKLLGSNIVSHIILLVYFLVVLSVVKSFIPDLAKTIVAQATSFASAIAPSLGAIGSGGKKFYQHKMAENETFQGRMSGWSKSAPPSGGNIFTKNIGNIASFAKRNIGTSLGPELQKAEKKSIDNVADSLKDASPEKIANHFRTLSGNADSEVKRVGTILAAHRAGVLDKVLKNLQDVLSKPEDFDKLFEKAEAAGHKSEFKKALPIHFMERETRGLTTSAKTQKIQDFVLGDLKGANMEKAAPQITEAINKGTTAQQALGKELVKAIMEAKDSSYINNYIKGSDGKTGAVVIEEYIDSVGSTKTGYSGTAKERGQVFRNINPDVAKQWKNNPGTTMLNIDLK